MRPIPKHEEKVYRCVERGEFEIDPDGSVWRVKTRRHNGRKEWFIPCPRRRAEGISRGGYLTLKACVNGRRYFAAAHRLVYFHFKGSKNDAEAIRAKIPYP